MRLVTISVIIGLLGACASVAAADGRDSAEPAVIEFRIVMNRAAETTIEREFVHTDGRTETLHLNEPLPLSKAHIIRASTVPRKSGDHVIDVELTQGGGQIFHAMTADNVGERMAIVIHGKVVVAANINEPISMGQFQISSAFSAEEAQRIARALSPR